MRPGLRALFPRRPAGQAMVAEIQRQAPPRVRADRWTLGALAAVLLAGFFARSLATLTPPLVVGDDGAYYLIQVRSILRGGLLAIPDFPLLFYVQAGVAGFFSLLMEQRAAIIAAVRITDTFLPLALAVPVFLFASAFARPGNRPTGQAVAVAVVGLVATVSGHALFMAGGMIKNAVALPCSFFFAFACYEWIRRGEPRALAWAGFWYVLASLTHMGGLILSTTFAASLLALGLSAKEVRRRVWLPAVLLAVCFLGCLATVYALDPVRAQRLVHAVAAPGWLLEGAPTPLRPPGVPGAAVGPASALREFWLGMTLGAFGIVALWRHRATMEPATRILVTASTAVTLAFSMPLLRPDVLERLALLAYVPAMIPVVYLVGREVKAAWLVAPIVVVAMMQGGLSVKTLRLTALVPAAHEELVQFRSVVPAGRVIVIARPLLRWWVAWTMEAHFSTRVGRALAVRDAYSAVLVLDEIRPGAFGVAPAPAGFGSLGAGVRDARLLRSEEVTVLTEGTYFRLSRVTAARGDPREARVRAAAGSPLVSDEKQSGVGPSKPR